MRAIGAVAALSVGCGDDACEPAIVVIQTPKITVDRDTAAPGVQAQIRVTTSAPGGSTMVLEVLDGAVVSDHASATVEDGEAVFDHVTVPFPAATLVASVAAPCGTGRDSVTVDVTAADCMVTTTPAPRPNAFYAPLDVLIAAADPVQQTPGFQATLVVTTHPGWTVDLFASADGPEEQVSAQANDHGIARIPRTLGEGINAYRAMCSRGSESAVSLATTVFVDTQKPSCAFTAPQPGSTITPTLDLNNDLSDGVQFVIAAQIGGNDVLGEPATIKLAPLGGPFADVNATAIDAAGTSTAPMTLAPPATPASYALELIVTDHAGNKCIAGQAYDVVYNGCEIAITSPTSAITADADGNPANGSQVDFDVTVDTACAGRLVTSTCGNNPSGTLPANGQLRLRATVCARSPCEVKPLCVFRVTTDAGVKTAAGRTITFDDLGPTTTVDTVSPALACGTQLTSASDVNPNVAGVQITARVTSTTAAQKKLEVTTGLGTTTVDAAADVELTLQPNANTLVGAGFDVLGNRGASAACTVTLADP